MRIRGREREREKERERGSGREKEREREREREGEKDRKGGRETAGGEVVFPINNCAHKVSLCLQSSRQHCSEKEDEKLNFFVEKKRDFISLE